MPVTHETVNELKAILVKIHMEIRKIDMPLKNTRAAVYTMLGQILISEDDNYLSKTIPASINRVDT